MKVNVKGLVFVGFAAAILAGAAHAEGENIVTSKAYTDATYQAKADKLTGGTGSTIGGNSSDTSKFTTAAAVVEYVGSQITTAGGNYQVASTTAQQVSDGAGGWQNLTKDTTVAENSANPVTSGAVYNALHAGTNGAATYQTASTAAHKLSNASGGWEDLTNGFANGTYTEKSADANGVVTIDVNALADTTSGNFDNVGGSTPATQADNNKLPTAAAVKAYVDNKATTDLSGKQDNLGGTGNGGKVVTATTTPGTVTYTEIDSAVTSGSNNLITSDAVYDALHGDGTTDLGYERVENKVSSIASGEENNTTKYTSNAAVTGYAQAKVGGGSNAGKLVTATSTAGNVNYTAVESTGSNIATNGTDIPTTGAVADYVASQITSATGGNTIPGQNTTTVCGVVAPCALVAESTGLHWRTMATGTHNGGTCGDATGNCGDA